MEETLGQPIILNSHTKLNFSSTNPYFYSIPLKYITDTFTIIRDLCQFLQPGLISCTRFEEKLGHSSQLTGSAKLEKKLPKNLSSRFSVLTTALLGK